MIPGENSVCHHRVRSCLLSNCFLRELRKELEVAYGPIVLLFKF